MTLSIFLLAQLFDFLKIILGSIQKPYSTFRDLALNHKSFHFLYIAALVFVYLMLSTLAKEGLESNPLFLTKSLIKAGLAISLTFLVMVGTIYVIGKQFEGEGDISTIIKLWAFSLVPTLAWFLISTFFYVLLPPPKLPQW